MTVSTPKPLVKRDKGISDLNLENKIDCVIRAVTEKNWHYGAGEIIDQSKFHKDLREEMFNLFKELL